MIRWSGSSSFVVFAVALAAGVASSPAGAQSDAAPLIAGVHVDTAQQTLNILGLNFGDAPQVSLALSPLTVIPPSTSTTVVTDRPPLPAGTYLMVLERSDGATSNFFYLTLGAVGPQGPAGPQGAAGPSGAVAADRVLAALGEGSGDGAPDGRVDATLIPREGGSTTNTLFGISALAGVTTGIRNTAFGDRALRQLTTGGGNVAFGDEVLSNNLIGVGNTGVGGGALQGNLGSFNLAVGQDALRFNVDGFWNVGLGASAGSANTSGSYNIYIGHAGEDGESGVIRIGGEQHERTFLSGTVQAPAFAGDGSALTGVTAVYQ